MSYEVENIVVGAGVVGLAIARELAKSGREVLVLEKNSHFGEETSSRNSEVIHAGIYYEKNSLKARFCVEGKELLYQYCHEYSIPHAKIGKLIVAGDYQERQVLSAIKQKALDNGVNDLTYLDSSEAKALEPALNCSGALLSPSTGIIDTHQYMLSLVGEIERFGGTIAFNASFTAATPTSNGFIVSSDSTKLTCKNLINAAGLGAQKVASQIDGLSPDHIPPRFLAKGSYFTMNAPSPFNHLIYPVPNTVGLGIHVTLDMAGQIRFGPDQEWVTEINYDMAPSRGHAFYAAIRRYYPGLADGTLIPAYSGIRPKIQSPDSNARDFDISCPKTHTLPGLINLFGIESPGLTSSLRIGQHICEILRDFRSN